ncbi:GerMN domain-containing protein [Actinacidiphila yeochonensis]|uniref:GerMN domain-containing protein n=1 Tax=Actinacidiphila yeochonensis TaxID=89050 RepID=UPI00056A77E9|nr:GerMN domain-containing protein [Actinacidiphila yeochonensis]
MEGDDDPVAAALEQLLAGPSGEEGRKGLTTSVPEPASVLQLRTGEDTVAVTLAAGTAEFDDTALRQLACTAAVALNRQRAREVPPAQAGGSAAPAVPMPTEPPVTVTVTVTVTVPGPGWQRVEQSDGCPSEAVAQ